MSEDLIRYDILAQEALRGVVKKVLSEVATSGLPGEHHFYISFDTRYPGVRLSSAMRERYPDEMTIVVQHQFWDLKVHDTNFEIGLSFNDVPERLLVPFAAIKNFFDPSVEFGVQFDVAAHLAAAEAEDEPEKAQAKAKPKLEAVKSSAKETKKEAEVEKPQPKAKPAKKAAAKKDAEPDEDTAAAKDLKEDKTDAKEGAQVVSLDAFRKKPS